MCNKQMLMNGSLVFAILGLIFGFGQSFGLFQTMPHDHVVVARGIFALSSLSFVYFWKFYKGE